jgi:hypothetical protein
VNLSLPPGSPTNCWVGLDWIEWGFAWLFCSFSTDWMFSGHIITYMLSSIPSYMLNILCTTILSVHIYSPLVYWFPFCNVSQVSSSKLWWVEILWEPAQNQHKSSFIGSDTHHATDWSGYEWWLVRVLCVCLDTWSQSSTTEFFWLKCMMHREQ